MPEWRIIAIRKGAWIYNIMFVKLLAFFVVTKLICHIFFTLWLQFYSVVFLSKIWSSVPSVLNFLLLCHISPLHDLLGLLIFFSCATELLHDWMGQEQNLLEGFKDWQIRALWTQHYWRLCDIFRNGMPWSLEEDTRWERWWIKICYLVLWDCW